MKSYSNHIIGEYEGDEPGPLLICLAGMHGNEPAGVMALETVFHLLEREPLANPEFRYKGKIVGILGNVQAFRNGKRYMAKDLNRMWTADYIRQIKSLEPDELRFEEIEIKELLELFSRLINEGNFQQVVMLDLHTTSAGGGIFSIATDDRESIRIATELHAPVITGMMRGIKGTTLHFFTLENLQQFLAHQTGNNHKPPPASVTGVAFEAGQHADHLSVNRCIAAIINCMRSIGSVESGHVENRHDEILLEYSKDLPKIAELIQAHSIKPEDNFRMKPGYRNFQPVQKGEYLAEDRHGVITSPDDGMILMPLYQPQGSDGFFLIKEVHFDF